MTNPDYRALCAELLQELCCHYRSWELKEGHCSDAMNRARALLDQPVAVAPTDEELDSVMFQAVWGCMDNASDLTNDEMDRLKARAVLAKWGI